MTKRQQHNKTESAPQATQQRLAIEEFLPTEFYSAGTAVKRFGKRQRRIFFAAICGVLAAALLAAAGSYWYRLKTSPADFFNAAELSAAPTPNPQKQTDPLASPEIAATPTPDPFAVLDSMAGPELEKDIVNILLIGVDYSEERKTWAGKDGLTAAHADVIIVLAVNFDDNTANLISLPRDTYTTVPGVAGIYKLNGSLNCGGGLLAENGEGFEKVCETASFLLGGLPVDYYYAVTMPAVKQLVDAIGGVDYNMDIEFKIQGRDYEKGKTHLDGQGVLDYLRVRKSVSGLSETQTGDAKRVNRQKKMLVAIFNQLKKKDMLLKVPDILEAFDGQLFTNCTASQTAALALYGSGMSSSDIDMYSMSGSQYSMYSWNFVFVNQKNRINLIKQIYGVEVPEIKEITYDHAQTVYQTKIANQYIKTCAPLTKHVEALLAADDLLPQYTATPIPTEQVSPAPTQTASPTQAPAAPSPDPENGTGAEDETIPVSAPKEQTRQYTEEQRKIYAQYLDALETCKSLRGTGQNSALRSSCRTLQTLAIRCASTFQYTKGFTWTIPPLANSNEVYVDFR